MSRPSLAPLVLGMDDIADAPAPLDGDCACPRLAPAPPRPPGRLPESAALARAEALREPLDAEHTALLAGAGLTVVDREALRIWEAFAGGRTPRAAAAAVPAEPGRVRDAAARLWAQGLLETPGHTPAPAEHPPALSAWLHLANDCALRCTYCYVQKSAERMAPELGLRAVERLVETACERGYGALQLKYAGGEPLLNPRALDAMQRRAAALCAEHGLRLDAVVLSSGTTLGPGALALIAGLGLRLSVSLDAVDAVQDEQRPSRGGAASLGAVTRGIERALAAGIRPHLSITLTRASVAGLAATLAWALDRGLTFQLNFERDLIGAGRPQLWDDQEAVIEHLRRALQVIEARPPRWSLLAALADRTNLSAPHRHACGAGRDYVVVDQRGRIAQCHMLLDRPVATIAAADLLAAVRAPGGRLPSPPAEAACAACRWAPWCAGGCPLLAPRPGAASPYCSLYRWLLPEVVRLEGRRMLAHAPAM